MYYNDEIFLLFYVFFRVYNQCKKLQFLYLEESADLKGLNIGQSQKNPCSSK